MNWKKIKDACLTVLYVGGGVALSVWLYYLAIA